MREGFTVWLTGCSKVGKTRLSILLEQHLYQLGIPFVQRLDGEVVRFDLSPNLGFTREDRDEHIRRIAFVAELLSHNGVATLVSCISPHRTARRKAKLGCLNFVEIYVTCPLHVAKSRDDDGLYERAERGEISDFTGISAPYEEPLNPDLIVHTDLETELESLQKIVSLLESRGFIPQKDGAGASNAEKPKQAPPVLSGSLRIDESK